MTPAVFLDRDGTMIEERGYLLQGATPQLFPWTIDAIRLLRRAGFAIVVITNQGGIGRGHYTCDWVEATHRTLGAQLAAAGAAIDGWYFCPHHEEATIDEWRGPCRCRKPAPGMIEDAAAALTLDLPRSWVIGDQWRDVQVGHAVGARTILVRSGHGRVQETTWPADIAPPTAIADDLIAAAACILR